MKTSVTKSLLTSLCQGITPLWKRGARGDFLNNVNSIMRLLIKVESGKLKVRE
jgi:hypothetical protein